MAAAQQLLCCTHTQRLCWAGARVHFRGNTIMKECLQIIHLIAIIAFFFYEINIWLKKTVAVIVFMIIFKSDFCDLSYSPSV